MFNAIVALSGLCWFCHTELFEEWKSIRIGGDQLSISLTVMIVLIYLVICIGNGVRWYFAHRRL